jgi:glycopeptide antibiotics resistance protein
MWGSILKNNKQPLWILTLYGFFIVYVFLLLYLLVFQRLGSHPARDINLVPFKSISAFVPGLFGTSDSLSLVNIFGNIFMFSPMGLYFPVLAPGRKPAVYLLWVSLFSLTAEVLQYALSVGTSDIDDLILNTLGGLLGIVAYRVLLALAKREDRARLFTALVSAVAGIPALLVAAGIYLANL